MGEQNKCSVKNVSLDVKDVSGNSLTQRVGEFVYYRQNYPEMMMNIKIVAVIIIITIMMMWKEEEKGKRKQEITYLKL